MPTIVNVHEAKTELSRLLERVERGEAIVIARAGKPVARLSRYEPPRDEPRPLGLARTTVSVSGDFDAPFDDDLLDLFDHAPLRNE